ncbi:type II toxin-antitoxin system YafQ family toxin [Alloscardovia omnicolens]|uniref:Toxin-antitoxin system, toxin component, RelE domain protein n=1 Tax=Alloscardovia omnicolens F0580 TaxID=1321816 RepID=U1RES1_9BIFI|nr:toxin-antitoxin system, toxin component, RelE domain protein [Alloscardovia omnicolens F0580]
MLDIIASPQFRRDIKKMTKRGADMHLLDTILRKLSKGIPLDPHHKDYALTRNYKGFRECHI